MLRFRPRALKHRSGQATRFQPSLETLEDRSVPALFATTFRINLIAGLDQLTPVTAGADNGMFVAVWETDFSGGDTDIYARVYGPDRVVRQDIAVANTGRTEHRPAVAMDRYGNFVIAWEDAGNIVAQRYDSQGLVVGSQISVAAYSVPEESPSIAMAASGAFVIAYTRWLTPTESDVLAKSYGFDGSLLRTIYVAATPSTEERDPSVGRSRTLGSSAVFTIAYNLGEDVVAKRYSAYSFPVGTHTLANAPGYFEGDVSVDMDNAGNSVVAWQAYVPGTGPRIQARKIFSTGSLSSTFLIAMSTTSSQTSPTVAIDPNDGDFVVSFHSVAVSGSQFIEYPRVTEVNTDGTVRITYNLGPAALSISNPVSVALAGDGYYLLAFDAFNYLPGDTDQGVYGRWGRLY